MSPPIGVGCGNLFRRALTEEPADIQQRLLSVRKKIEQGAAVQAYHLLESQEVGGAAAARLYEQIGRNILNTNKKLATASMKKAILLYKESRQDTRAKYLSMLTSDE